jgi:surface carbohydrate biosynthesis protein
MKKILIYSHNPHRDKMFDTLLKCELEKKDNLVWLHSFLSNDTSAICTIKPDIIVLPEMRVEYSANMALWFKKWGGKVVVRTCELGVTEEAVEKISDEYKAAIYGHLDTDALIDRVLVFGEKQKAMMSRYGKVKEDKLYAVGGMPFEQYFTDLPEVQSKKKPIMLFCTGFPYADRNECYSIPEAPVNSPLHKQKVLESRILRSKWIQIISQIAHVYSDRYEIVVRPHGGELHEPYKEIIGNAVNVSTKTVAAVQLHNCDIVVHAGSTMGFEAHLENKPGVCMFPMSEDPVVTGLHPIAGTLEEFVNIIESLDTSKSNADPDKAKLLHEYYGPVDGKSAERAAEVICGIETTPTSIPEKWPEIKTPQFLNDPDVVTEMTTWHCAGCFNNYFVLNLTREMVKCPYCGIGNVRTKQASMTRGVTGA